MVGLEGPEAASESGLSGAGGPVVGLEGPEAASEIGLSGAGGPVVGLEGPEAASERGLSRLFGRATALVLLVGAGLLGSAVSAEAHTRTEETTNVHSRITSADLPDGLEVTVHTGGLLIEMSNTTDVPLIVHGYDGEPYLRIGPDGVEHNRRSPAAHLNRERYGDVAMPPGVDADASPEWVRIADEPRHLWHDHRTHWMSPQPPGFVDAGPIARAIMGAQFVGPIGRAHGAAGAFQDWAVPLTYGDRSLTVEGELIWRDPPSPWPWLALGALLVAPALLGLRRQEVGSLVRPAALVVFAVAMINTIHLVDDLVAWPSDPLDELSGLLHTSIFLVGGIGGALWAWFGSSGRVLALGIGSASVLYHQGLIHLPMLFASAFPTVWPDGLVRLTIALGLLQGVVVAAVVIRALRDRAPWDLDERPRRGAYRDVPSPEEPRLRSRGDEEVRVGSPGAD